MADFTIYELGSAASRTGAILWVQIPSAAPSGYTDLQIDIPTLLAAEQASIISNSSDISALDARVVVVENGLTKSLLKNRNTSYEHTQNADSRIINFGFRTVSGTPTVSVGTTLGADDIVTSREITGLERSINILEYTNVSRTLYITITGGIVDVAIFSRESLYNI